MHLYMDSCDHPSQIRNYNKSHPHCFHNNSPDHSRIPGFSLLPAEELLHICRVLPDRCRDKVEYDLLMLSSTL